MRRVAPLEVKSRAHSEHMEDIPWGRLKTAVNLTELQGYFGRGNTRGEPLTQPLNVYVVRLIYFTCLGTFTKALLLFNIHDFVCVLC